MDRADNALGERYLTIMASLDALTTTYLRQSLRPRKTAWFDEADLDNEPTTVMHTIGSLVDATPCAVDEATLVRDVQKLLVDHHLTAVPVVDAGSSLTGVVTCADLLRASSTATAATAMSTALTIRATASIEAAAQLVAREHAEYVVVTDGVGQPIGVVTANAIVRHLADPTRR